MIEHHDYPISVEWTGGTRGLATSSEGVPSLTVAAPPEFGGDAGVWSPEHLLVGAVASCYMTTFLAIARHSKLEVLDLRVDVTGSLERGDDRLYRFPRFEIRPEIGLASANDEAKAHRIAAKADHVCLVSRSLDAKIVVVPRIRIATPEVTG